MEKQTVLIKKTVDDFHKIGDLNTKRIKAYNDIAKDYNVPVSVIRDIFSLGINFAIANLEEIELPSKEEIQEVMDNLEDNENNSANDEWLAGVNFILNKIESTKGK